jgi:hypothetical protein
MADKLLAVRGGEPVGKCWAERFVTHSAELKQAQRDAQGLILSTQAITSGLH